MIEFIRTLWSRASVAKRGGLLAGFVLAMTVPTLLFWWWGRPDYQVLFVDLDARDAAAVVASLEKQKTPYRLADEGKTVLVEKASLYKTRMQLMGGGLDLKGTVGFELFNDAKFGMTEFTQKINYQRALEGELARTIMGFDEVRNARAHLVLPNRGLLRKAGEKAKASVWVTLDGGKRLQPEQVIGIQRLVSAAVPEMAVDAVTVLDQSGRALSALSRDEDGAPAEDAALRLKQHTEAYLTQKVTRILDAALGANQAAVGVNVVLEHKAVKTTRESVLGEGGGSGTGVLVRQREHWIGKQGEMAVPAEEPALEASRGRPTSRTVDSEFQVGREVSHILSGMGAIKQLSLGIVTAAPLSAEKVERLKPVIAMAVGLDAARGDDMAFSVVAPNAAVPPPPARALPPAAPASADKWRLAAIVLALTGLIAGLVLYYRSRRSPSLSVEERARVLVQVRQWLNEAPLSEEGRP